MARETGVDRNDDVKRGSRTDLLPRARQALRPLRNRSGPGKRRIRTGVESSRIGECASCGWRVLSRAGLLSETVIRGPFAAGNGVIAANLHRADQGRSSRPGSCSFLFTDWHRLLASRDHVGAAYAAADGGLVRLKTGGPFSRNAAIASLVSADRPRAANSLFSTSIACSICPRMDAFSSLLQACNAAAGFYASFWAVSVAVASSVASGTTRVTNPSSAARLASKGWPSRINSAARRYPMRAGIEQDDPNSGTRPRLIKGNWNFVLSPAKTKSQCVSIVVPPPIAAPCTATTRGLSKFVSALSRQDCGLSPGPGGFLIKSSRSLPAQNESPAPCQSTAFT